MNVPRGGFQQPNQPNNLQLPASAIHLNTKYWINEGLPHNFPYHVDIRLPEHLYQFCAGMAGHLAFYLQESANISAARIFTFNLLSRNAWNNTRFGTLLAMAVEYLEVVLVRDNLPLEQAYRLVGDEYSVLATANMVREFTPLRQLCSKEIVYNADMLSQREHVIASEKHAFYQNRGALIPNANPPSQWPRQQQNNMPPQYQQQQQQYYQQQQNNQWPPQQQGYIQQQDPYQQQNQWLTPQQQQQQYYQQQQNNQWPPQQQGYIQQQDPYQQPIQRRQQGYVQPQFHQQQNNMPPQYQRQQQQYYQQQQNNQWPPQQQQQQGYIQNPWPPQQQQQQGYIQNPWPPQQQGNAQQNQWPTPQQQQQQNYQQQNNQWLPVRQQLYNQQPLQNNQQPQQQNNQQQPQPQQNVSNNKGVRSSALTNFIPVQRTDSNKRPTPAVTQRLGDNGYEDFRTDAELLRDSQRNAERQRELAEIVEMTGGMVAEVNYPNRPKATIETWGKVYGDPDSHAERLFAEIEEYEAGLAKFVHPLTPEQQKKFNIPNRQPTEEIINTATGKPLPTAEAKSRPYDSITTKGGEIRPHHLCKWTRSWSIQQPFDAAWDPSTHFKFLRNDGEEIHELIEPLVEAMDYLKHEISPNLKRNLPVDQTDKKVVANFELLNTLHEIGEENDPTMKELKLTDIANSTDTLLIPETFMVCEGTSVYFDVAVWLSKHELAREIYRRPVEVKYYGTKLYMNSTAGETSLKGIMEAIDEIDSIDEFVRYLRRLENSKKVPDHFLSEIVAHSTKELNKALLVGMNMNFDVDNILEDWVEVKKEFYEQLGEECGNEYLTTMEVAFGRRIITGGRELADPDEHEALLSEKGLYSRYSEWKDKVFVMMTLNTETIVPWRAGDISLCLTEGKGVIYESKLPKLFTSIKSIVKRHNRNVGCFKHRYIRTADSRMLDIHTGALGKDYYILEEV